MQVDTVKIKEFKCLEDLNVEVKGQHILLMGDNGVGKSSFMQFIRIALGDQTSIPLNAKGEGEVLINKDGQAYTFHVKFKDGKPVVTVTSPDGMKDNRKGTIAGIVGAMEFDIDSFVELSKSTAGKKKQVEIFKSFLPPEVREELTRYETNVAVSMEERKEVNKLLKQKEGFIQTHRLFPVIGVKKFERKDIKELIEDLKAKNEHNVTVEKAKKHIEDVNKQISETETKIAELQETLKGLNEKKIKADTWINAKENAPHPSFVIEAAEQAIDDLEKTNKDYDDSVSLKAEMELVEKMKDEAGELTAKIGSSKEAIAIAIRDMDSPVQGLTYDDETLIYNGIPVSPDSLSTSEIMELGIRLKMAENPDLGILFIERGESLGSERLKTIKELADSNGWMIIMEQVERGAGFHVEVMGE